MTLHQGERAIWAAARDWAASVPIQFVHDNSLSTEIQPGSTGLVWRFVPATSRRLTLGGMVRHEGAAIGSLRVPAGSGLLGGLTLAEGLKAALAGKDFAGLETVDEASFIRVGREGAHYRLDVQLPWTMDLAQIPRGATTAHVAATALTAWQAVRREWNTRIEVPLGLKTFTDNGAPEADTPPPWALLSFRTLEPFAVETQRMMVPGRALAALTFAASGGTDPTATVIEAIVLAFDGISVDGLQFQTPEVNRVGLTPLKTWQANVRLPFLFEVLNG